MTIAERNNKLKHYITCLKCKVSGKGCDDNCSVQYDAGNVGEIIENLEAISKFLEQEPKTGYWIYSGSYDVEGMLYCSKCKHEIDVSEGYFNFCPNCGAKMEVEK